VEEEEEAEEEELRNRRTAILAAIATRKNQNALLGPLLERLPEVFAKVLACLDPSDNAALAQVGTPWLAAMVNEGVARAGKRGAGNPPLRLSEYLGSIARLAGAYTRPLFSST